MHPLVALIRPLLLALALLLPVMAAGGAWAHGGHGAACDRAMGVAAASPASLSAGVGLSDSGRATHVASLAWGPHVGVSPGHSSGCGGCAGGCCLAACLSPVALARARAAIPAPTALPSALVWRAVALPVPLGRADPPPLGPPRPIDAQVI